MHDPLEVYVGQLDELIARAEVILRRAEEGPKAHITFKTVAQVTRDYEDALDRFVREGLRTRDAVDLRRAHKALLRSGIAEQAYKEGMREAGSRDPDEDYDAEDVLNVAKWLDGQLAHVNDFARAVTDAGGVGAPEEAAEAILARVPTWVQSLESLGAQGKASFLANRPGTWEYGDTEHCDTCLNLNGQRHRLKWFTSRGYIPRQPGSNTLDCRGFRCQCRIISDDGDQLMP